MIFHRIFFGMLTALVLTVAIEAVFAFLFGVRTGRGQFIVLLANVFTNPLLNAVLTLVSFYLSPTLYYWFLVPLEILVIFAEGRIYQTILHPKMQPYLLSFLLNAASFLLGTAIKHFISF